MPIERASTVVFDDLADFQARGDRLYDGFSYGLYGTPTSRRLEDHVALLEGGTRALLTPSGMAAMTLATLAFCRAGDRLLVPDTLYGPAKDVALRFLSSLGVETVVYDPRLDGEVAGLLGDRTRLVWVESPGSGTFEVQDLPAIATAAHAAGALVACDNTWASHLLFKPLAHGADISMQALSKHASGHGDLLMGSLAVTEEALFRRLKDTARFLGYGVSPDDCALCERGLMTMPVRMRQSASSAERVIAWLEQRPQVARILHPAQADHPGHEIWKRDFAGAPGVFAIVLDPACAAQQAQALKRMRLFRLGASWGGVHSLVAVNDPRKGRAPNDWLPPGPVWRLSIGLEDADDLIADLDRAFSILPDTAVIATPGEAAE